MISAGNLTTVSCPSSKLRSTLCTSARLVILWLEQSIHEEFPLPEPPSLSSFSFPFQDSVKIEQD